MSDIEYLLFYICIGSMTGTFIAYFIAAVIELVSLIKKKIDRKKNDPLDIF